MTEQQPKELIIPLELVQAIGNYLAQKPYGEVYQLIAALQQLQPALQEPPSAAKETKQHGN